MPGPEHHEGDLRPTGFSPSEHLKALFEYMLEGVALYHLVCDESGRAVDYRVLDVNPQFERHTGLRRAEVVGRLASEIYGTGVPPYLEEYASVALGGPPLTLETYFAPLDRHFEISVAPLGPKAFATFFSDVTVTKKQQETLEKTHLAQRAVIDNQPQLTWLKDRQGRFLVINKAFSEACGQPSPDAVIGKTDLDVWPKHLAEAYRADDEEVMRTGVQKIVEECIETAAGTRCVETYKSPVFAPDGSIIGTTGIARDITDSRRAMEAMRRSEQKFEQVFDLAPNPIGVSELTGEFLFVNQAFCQTTGYTRAELLGRRPADLGLWENPDLRVQIVERTKREGRVDSVEFTILSKTGERRYMEMSCAIISLEDEQVMITAARDVTERRKLEQQVMQSQKLESLGILAGGIAHDFNNLLTSILGNADLASRELSPASSVRIYLEDIEKVSRRAAELCRQMLAYSGKGRFVVQPVSLNEIVREMAHLLSVSISKKAVIKYNFFSQIPSMMADASQIRQIVMNLITNASDAVAEVSGVITLSTGVMDCDDEYLRSAIGFSNTLRSGQYVYLEVCDTGCGIEPENLGRIFDPFFTTKFTGRGLGLAAVLGIVRGHGGALRVYSEAGRGTTFKILFPVHHEPVQDGAATGAEPSSWTGHGLVLLADDEESIRSMGRRMLEHLGFEVILAADGREAVETFVKTWDKICLVILDLTMPHLDGEACFRELRRIQPTVKVIMTSGYNEQEVISRFAGKGLAGFVQKPYGIADLIPVISSALSESD